MILILLSTFLAVLLVGEVCIAATYYVSPAGNDLGQGTEASPWRTLSKAAQSLNPGDTVYIKGGAYAEQVVPARSGLAGNEITYAAFPGHAPVLDGQVLSLADRDWGGLFWIRNRSHIVVRGLTIQNSASISGIPGISGILVTSSSNIRIEDNVIFNTRSSGIGVWDSEDVQVLGNDIQRAVNGGSQECITVANSSHFEIARNHVHNGSHLEAGGEGIDIKQASSYGLVHHNHIHDLPGEVGLYIDAYDSSSPGLHHVDVYSNTIYRVDAGIAIAAERGGLVRDIRVFNNLVHHNASHGIIVADWGGANEGDKKNIAIFNNTVVANGSESYGGGLSVGSDRVEQISLYNNVLSDNLNWQLSVNLSAESQVSATHNLLYGSNDYDDGRIRSITGASAIVAKNPLFVGGTDYHLQYNSPAVNRGRTSGAPASDLEDVLRPQGSGYDIGAYECALQDATPPVPPKGFKVVSQ